jgi:uncharacterized protein
MVDDLYEVRDDGTVVLAVHAQPGAGRSAVVGRHGDALKVRVAAPPERGRANEAVAAMLAELLGVKPSAVSLVSGETSRQKRFAVAGVDLEELDRVLEEAVAGGNEGGPKRVPPRR